MLVWSGAAPPLCLSTSEITEILYSYFRYRVELWPLDYILRGSALLELSANCNLVIHERNDDAHHPTPAGGNP